MNRFKSYFILLITSVVVFSCTKDNGDVEPPRDRSQQYPTDIASIEEYLKSHYIVKTTVNGETDVDIVAIPEGQQDNFVSIWDNTEFPLQFKEVYNDVRKTHKVDGASDDKVKYKLYYFIVNEGGGQKPISVDSVFTSYKGSTLKDVVFDARDTPFWSTYPAATNEVAVISGYRQFVPLLKSATGSSVGDDGTVTFTNSGLGVVFIPSGLAYYEKAQPNIGPYSSLVFKIRLNSLRFRDHDKDGILSKNEDLDANLDLYNDDTDGDNTPDFLDADDDGDGYTTLFEIQENGVIVFPYPTCDSGIPKYLDKTCHPPKPTK